MPIANRVSATDVRCKLAVEEEEEVVARMVS